MIRLKRDNRPLFSIQLLHTMIYLYYNTGIISYQYRCDGLEAFRALGQWVRAGRANRL